MLALTFLESRPTKPSGRGCVAWAGGWLAAVLGCLAIASAAHSHVLQGPHVLELMAAALSGGRALRVRQTVWLAHNGGPAQEINYAETLSFHFPGLFRSEARHEQSQRIVVSNHTRSVTVIDGTLISEHENRFEAYKDVLLHLSRKPVSRVLITWGVDLGVTSLGIWEGSVVYVIGAEYPNESASQLWVDKERFLPLRWIIRQPNPADGHDQQIEFVYRDWRSYGHTWYPMQIDTYLDGRMLRRSRVDRVEVDPDESAERFDIDRLIANSTAAQSWSREFREADDVLRTIDESMKKFQP